MHNRLRNWSRSPLLAMLARNVLDSFGQKDAKGFWYSEEVFEKKVVARRSWEPYWICVTKFEIKTAQGVDTRCFA